MRKKKKIIEPQLLAELLTIEANRRESLLGDTINLLKLDSKVINAAALRAGVRRHVFFWWWKLRKSGGPAALRPVGWDDISDEQLKIAKGRRAQLGQWADLPVITKSDIAAISKENNWTERKTKRWLFRYREAGLWGLIDGHGPANKRTKTTPPAHIDLGSVEESDFQVALQRFKVIESLGGTGEVSNEAVKTRALETGMSERNIRYYLEKYRTNRLAGLTKKRRSDKNSHPSVSQKMETIIVGIWLKYSNIKYSKVHYLACKFAHYLGELEPSPYVVRQICKQVPIPIKLLASGRLKEFNNYFRFSGKYIREEGKIYYALDYHFVDVFVKNLLRGMANEWSDEIIPQLSMIIEETSGFILAGRLSYDIPDQHETAALLYEAFVRYGAPDYLKCDNAKINLAPHVISFLGGPGTEIKPSPPATPQPNGGIETTFKSFELHMTTLEGYRHPDPGKRNENVRAIHTINDLSKIIAQWIDEHNNKICSGDKLTRKQLFSELFTIPVDERELDILLMEAEHRQILKSKINYKGAEYWSPELGPYVNQTALIRSLPSYEFPDFIEVFVGDEHICRAPRIDSDDWKKYTTADISRGITAQRSAYKSLINGAMGQYKAVLDSLGVKSIQDVIDNDRAVTGKDKEPTRPPLRERLE